MTITTMTPGEAIVAKAREYVGTPFRHQGRWKGRGVDCVGLLACVAHELDLTQYDYTGYSRFVKPEQVRAALARVLRELDAGELLRAGDVLLFRIRSTEQHVAIWTDDETMIHAYECAGRVVEHRYAESWRRRTVGRFRWE
jgi:NlpC/P60 family putative phage cell wall peptidase